MAMHVDMEKFVTCIQCKEVPTEAPLYNCREGHIICEYCFLESTIGDRKTNTCIQCGSRIIARNIFGEQLLQSFSSPMNNTEIKKTYSKTSSRITPQTSFSQRSNKSASSFDLHIATTLANTSRRPILCPNTDCNRMIAVTQLISHFQFEHSRIPIESLEFNQPKSLVLSLNSMDYGKTHCVGLLLISSEKDTFSLGLSQDFHKKKIAFPLLAAKLRCKPDVENCVHLPRDLLLNTSKENLNKKVEEINYSDIVIIWICGNLDTNINCLIEVSDEKQTRIYSYFGAINSLREGNDPKSVFHRADCLLLHSSSIQRITKDGEFPMDLKVLINCPYNELV